MHYGRLDGPVIIIGFGSIGRGVLPLILRHFDVASDDIVVVAPNDDADAILEHHGIRRIDCALTRHNYAELLSALLVGPAPFIVRRFPWIPHRWI